MSASESQELQEGPSSGQNDPPNHTQQWWQPSRLLYTYKEARELLSISRTALFDLINEGLLKPVYVVPEPQGFLPRNSLGSWASWMGLALGSLHGLRRDTPCCQCHCPEEARA